jgi:O-antigen ligase
MTNSNLNVSEKPENKSSAARHRSAATDAIAPDKTWASRSVFFILCAAIGLTTLAYGTVHPPTIGLFWASAAAILVLWMLDAWRVGALRVSKSWLQLSLVGAIVYGILQIIPFGGAQETAGVAGLGRTISYDPYATLLAVVQFAALLVYLAAALVFVDTPQRLKTIVYFITVFGFLFAFFAIIQNLLDPTRIYGVYERPYIQNPFGSFINRHNYAAVIEMAIALPLGLLLSGAVAKDKRLLFLTAIGLMGVSLILSGSRGGLVAFVAEVIFMLAIARKSGGGKQFVLKVALAVALLLTIIGGTILIGGDSTLTRLAETAGSKDPTSSRTQIWETTLDVIRQNPILGAGFGAFGVAYTQFDPMNGRERVEQSHNDYLQIVADAGIVGVLLGALFVFALFRDGWRRLESKDTFRRGVALGALAGCFAIFVHSLFDFVLHTTSISLLFLTVAALATVNGRVETDESSEYSSRHRGKHRHRASVTPIESKRKPKELNESNGTA